MKKPYLLVIFLTVFIDLIGFGIVLPLLPTYAEEYHASGFLIGLISASFSLMQFLFAPAWGRLSDRIGRRPVLLISNFGSAASYGLFALSAWPGFSHQMALAVLLISRVFAGVCGASLSVASAYIADITPPEGRSKGLGLIGAAFGLGFLIGPPLGSLSASYLGLSGPGCVAAAFCLGNFILAYFKLLESRQPGSAQVEARPRMAQWGHVFRQPKVGALIGLFALSTFCFASYECTLPLLLGSPGFHPDDFVDPPALVKRLLKGEDGATRQLRAKLPPEFLTEAENDPGTGIALKRRFFREINGLLDAPPLFDETIRAQMRLGTEAQALLAHPATSSEHRRLNRLLLEAAFPGLIKTQALFYDKRRIGFVFMYCGLISVLIQGGMIGRLVKRFGEKHVILASLVIIAGSLALVPYMGSLTSLLVVLGLVSIGTSINRAPTMGLISLYSPAHEQGAVMGVAQSAGTLARVVGPPLANSLYAFSPHSPYWLAAVVAAAASLIAWRALRGPEPLKPEARAGSAGH